VLPGLFPLIALYFLKFLLLRFEGSNPFLTRTEPTDPVPSVLVVFLHILSPNTRVWFEVRANTLKNRTELNFGIYKLHIFIDMFPVAV